MYGRSMRPPVLLLNNILRNVDMPCTYLLTQYVSNELYIDNLFPNVIHITKSALWILRAYLAEVFYLLFVCLCCSKLSITSLYITCPLFLLLKLFDILFISFNYTPLLVCPLHLTRRIIFLYSKLFLTADN